MSYSPSQYRVSKRYREKQKKLGLCAYCTESAVKGKTRCQGHIDKLNERNQRRKKRYKKIGGN